jgi:hypothetical protein
VLTSSSAKTKISTIFKKFEKLLFKNLAKLLVKKFELRFFKKLKIIKTEKYWGVAGWLDEFMFYIQCLLVILFLILYYRAMLFERVTSHHLSHIFYEHITHATVNISVGTSDPSEA